MRLIRHLLLLLLCNALLAPAMAKDTDIPAGVRVVTAPEVRGMVAEGKALLVNTLSTIEFQTQHIPGSINIPVDRIQSSPKMPKDKDKPIIFYCNGEACPYSRRASESAVKLGYRQVYWFKEGILGWRKYQYDMIVDKTLSDIPINKYAPKQFQKLIKDNVVVLDVRPRWWTESESTEGVIAGTTIMIPLIDLDKHIDHLPKNRPILVVDRLMRQSPHAAKFLKRNGYQVLGVLKGGAKRWVAEKMPVLKPQDIPAPIGE